MAVTPAAWAARTSYTVSPTMTARSGVAPTASSAARTMSGAGLLFSTSPELTTALMTSSQPIFSRKSSRSSDAPLVQYTTCMPRSAQVRISSGTSWNGMHCSRSGAQFFACPSTMLASVVPMRVSTRSSDPRPMARWMSKPDTSCPAARNASHQAMVCR